jgi:hypothetical protein
VRFNVHAYEIDIDDDTAPWYWKHKVADETISCNFEIGVLILAHDSATAPKGSASMSTIKIIKKSYNQRRELSKPKDRVVMPHVQKVHVKRQQFKSTSRIRPDASNKSNAWAKRDEGDATHP